MLKELLPMFLFYALVIGFLQLLKRLAQDPNLTGFFSGLATTMAAIALTFMGWSTHMVFGLSGTVILTMTIPHLCHSFDVLMDARRARKSRERRRARYHEKIRGYQGSPVEQAIRALKVYALCVSEIFRANQFVQSRRDLGPVWLLVATHTNEEKVKFWAFVDLVKEFNPSLELPESVMGFANMPDPA